MTLPGAVINSSFRKHYVLVLLLSEISITHQIYRVGKLHGGNRYLRWSRELLRRSATVCLRGTLLHPEVLSSNVPTAPTS
jgi:hypothetical protein